MLEKACPKKCGACEEESTTSTTTTTTLAPRQCESEADCQENAGCFADELTGINEFGELNTICHCFLEYVVDNSTASFPKTGDCIHYRDVPCNVNTEVNCFEDSSEWGICPYCRVSP